MWVTDLRHCLDASGALPDLPGPALSLALFQGSIVAWVTSHSADSSKRTNVTCRRRPKGRQCPGEIEAEIADSDATVTWACPVCGDGGLISGWQSTRWDRRRGGLGSR